MHHLFLIGGGIICTLGLILALGSDTGAETGSQMLLMGVIILIVGVVLNLRHNRKKKEAS